VSSDKDLLEKAKKDWYEQNLETFPLIPGDDAEYVPLPRSIF